MLPIPNCSGSAQLPVSGSLARPGGGGDERFDEGVAVKAVAPAIGGL